MAISDTLARPVRPRSRRAQQVFVLVTALLTSASLSESFRLPIGEVLLHPYLLPLLALFIGLSLRVHIPTVPPITRHAVYGLVLLSMVVGVVGGEISYAIRIGGFLATLVIVSSLCVLRADLVPWLMAGLALSALVISVSGLLSADQVVNARHGLDPTVGIGNRNTASLYTIPGLIVAMTLVLIPRLKRGFRIVGYVTILSVVAFTFGSGNRSGWLGILVLVLALPFVPRIPNRSSGRWRLRLLGIAGVGLMGLLVLQQTYGFVTIEDRLAATLSGQDSSDTRLASYVAMVGHAAEYPFGQAPSAVFEWLADEVGVARRYLDTHSMFSFVLGTAGIWGLALFSLAIVSWVKRLVDRVQSLTGWYSLTLLGLWILRGAVQTDALMAPGFAFALGIAASGVPLERLAGPPQEVHSK